MTCFQWGLASDRNETFTKGSVADNSLDIDSVWASTLPTEHPYCNEGLTDAGEVQQQVNCTDVEMTHHPPTNNVVTPKYKHQTRSHDHPHTHTQTHTHTRKIDPNSHISVVQSWAIKKYTTLACNIILHECLLQNTYSRWVLSKRELRSEATSEQNMNIFVLRFGLRCW